MTWTEKCQQRWISIVARWRRWQHCGPHITIGSNVEFAPGVDLDVGLHRKVRGRIQLGDSTMLSRGVLLHAWGGNICLEENVFVGPYTIVYGHGGVTIGPNSLISMQCCIVSSNHTVPDQNHTICTQPDIHLPTRIGSDVWLGAGTRVLGNVTIGDGAVVGAGSVVAKDIPPYSIAVGVPARVIKTRARE